MACTLKGDDDDELIKNNFWMRRTIIKERRVVW